MNVPKWVSTKLPHVYNQTEWEGLDQRQLAELCRELINSNQALSDRISALEARSGT